MKIDTQLLNRRGFLAMGLASAGVAATADAFSFSTASPQELLTLLQHPNFGDPRIVDSGFVPIPAERVVILGAIDFRGATALTENSDQLKAPDVRSNRIAKTLATYYGLFDREAEWADFIRPCDPFAPRVSFEALFLSDLDECCTSPLLHWWAFISEDVGQEGKQNLFLVQTSAGIGRKVDGRASRCVIDLLCQFDENPRKWERIASMNHPEATKFVNDQLVEIIRSLSA